MLPCTLFVVPIGGRNCNNWKTSVRFPLLALNYYTGRCSVADHGWCHHICHCILVLYFYYKVHQISKWNPLSLQALWIRVWIKGILTTHHLKGTSSSEATFAREASRFWKRHWRSHSSKETLNQKPDRTFLELLLKLLNEYWHAVWCGFFVSWNAEPTSTDSEAKTPFMKTPQECSCSASLF